MLNQMDQPLGLDYGEILKEQVNDQIASQHQKIIAATMMNFYQPSLFKPQYDSDEDDDADIFGKSLKKQRTEL